ncbi:MAG: hypothetical protein IPP79_03425 [Chitinophagaceae bacterium]|nr:hypothetical protein [Chitinophagaceae bacterium]
MGTWCAPCKKLTPKIKALMKSIKAKLK